MPNHKRSKIVCLEKIRSVIQKHHDAAKRPPQIRELRAIM